MRKYFINKSQLCIALALIISNITTASAFYNYRDMLCGIEHEGYSAPASVAFIFAIPGYVLSIIFIMAAIYLSKKSKEIR